MSGASPVAFVILAAGKGTRMKSSRPKVLAEVLGEPMIFGVLDSIREAAPHAKVALVVGYGKELVEQEIMAEKRFSSMSLSFVVQEEQLGTGHAAKVALESEWGTDVIKSKTPLIVLPGDFPLLRWEVVSSLVDAAGSSLVQLMTTRRADPSGYGRVVRGKGGLKIVEQADASDEEKKISEVAVSIYGFDPVFLNDALAGLKTDNAQGEYYLPDVVALASEKDGTKVVEWPHWEDLNGVNDHWERALAQEKLALRRVERFARAGVLFDDLRSVRLGPEVKIESGARIGSNVDLEGSTLIEAGVRIEADCTIRSTRVSKDSWVKRGCYFEDSRVASEVKIGPYAHLRPGSVVGSGSKIGNFVELKKTELAERVSVAHLAYLGDAKVGSDVNIGCGFITCNFDGRVIDGKRKHETVIEDGAFVGSDCQTVAPVTIGKGAYVASGTTVTKNVPDDALAIGRAKQDNKIGYASRLKRIGRSR